jgi:hypothetical protein
MNETCTAMDPLGTLDAWVRDRLTEGPRTWLDEGLEQIKTAADPRGPLARWSAAAARRLGQTPLGATAVALDTPCGTLDASRWGLADAARALLLGTAAGRPGVDGVALFGALYRDGDEGERVSLVRAFCLTPDPCRLLNLAREAGRFTSLHLYAALALDNPFPAACYPAHDFNGLVLKCLFNALPVGRISGLGRRADADLARMCEDYRDERVLAGRTIPADIWLPLVPHASPRGLTLAMEAAQSDEPAHRYHAVLALWERRAEPEVGAALAARRAVETDPRIGALLTRA